MIAAGVLGFVILSYGSYAPGPSFTSLFSLSRVLIVIVGLF